MVVKNEIFILHRVLIFLSFSLKTAKVAIVVADIITSSVASVAQLVEQWVVMREVVSSTPAGPTLRVLK